MSLILGQLVIYDCQRRQRQRTESSTEVEQVTMGTKADAKKATATLCAKHGRDYFAMLGSAGGTRKAQNNRIKRPPKRLDEGAVLVYDRKRGLVHGQA